MKSTEERIEKLKETEYQLSEKIKVADFEIQELQDYVSNLRYKQGKVQNRLFKIMGADIQRNLRSMEFS